MIHRLRAINSANHHAHTDIMSDQKLPSDLLEKATATTDVLEDINPTIYKVLNLTPIEPLKADFSNFLYNNNE